MCYSLVLFGYPKVKIAQLRSIYQCIGLHALSRVVGVTLLFNIVLQMASVCTGRLSKFAHERVCFKC